MPKKARKKSAKPRAPKPRARKLDDLLTKDVRALLNHIPEFVLVMDRSSVIHFLNATVPEFQREQILGTKAIDLTAAEYRKDYLKAINTVMDSGLPYTFEARDSNGRTYITCIVPFGNRAGFVLAISTDITERKRMEEDLRSNREFVDRMAQASPHIMYVFNIQLRVNVYANRQIARDLGYAPNEIREMGGEFLAKLMHPGDFKQALEHMTGWDGVQDGEVREIEYRMRNKDGAWRWFLGRDTVFSRDGRGHVVEIIGTAQDITSRKLAEERLIASEKRLNAILQYTPNVAVQAYDPDGRVLSWNHASENIFGYTAQAAVGRTLDQLILTTEQFQNFQKILRGLKPDESAGPMEFAFRRRDGSTGVCLSTIFEIPRTQGERNFICMDVDISERKQAETALRESEQRNRTLVEYAPEALVVFDLDQQSFVDFNENAVKLFGFSREELLTKNPVELSSPVAPDGRPSPEAAAEYLGRALNGESPVFEWTHTDRSGREIPCEVRLVRLPAGPRKLVRGSVIDITERKRLEEQLRQIQKVESIGRLAGGVAHDFNNLLTSILGFAELALGSLETDSPTAAHLRHVRESAVRGGRLTQQLLAFARRQVIQPQVVNLGELIAQLSTLLRRLIGENIQLMTMLPENLDRVKVDLGQIEQVLMNLAINARDAMPHGGSLIIEARNVGIDSEYARSHLEVQPGAYVEIDVTDTGTGIPPDVLPHIFEPFFTTKPAPQGTGLGLSMCYGIVKQSGGHISVYSEVGKGTTFKIYLPRTDEGKRPVMPENHAVNPNVGHETILLVEDDEMIRTLANEVLKMKGYEVICAEDGLEALEKIRATTSEIHLIITDVVMPKMGGRELAEVVKKERPKIRVLYSSGYTENAIVHQGVLDEGTYFIQKPYTPSSLTQKVREILDTPFSKSVGT